MPHPKLLAVITALLFLGQAAGVRADFTLDQLREIDRLVTAKDTAALGFYLRTNPQILQGDDPLARELRRFMECVASGRLDCFASEKVVAKTLEKNDNPPEVPVLH